MPASPYKPKVYLEYRESMVNYMVARASRLSNFNPGSRAGSLFEGLSLSLSDSDVRVFNGFRSAIIEGAYNTFKFRRLPGTKGSGIIKLEHSGHDAPQVYDPFIIDLFGLRVETLEQVTIDVGQTAATVNARMLDVGLTGNIEVDQIDTADGRGTIQADYAFPTGTRVWNSSRFQDGTDEESDSGRLIRFQGYINSLARSPLLGIEFGARSVPGVLSAVVQSNINPYSQTGEVGWVNVFVSDGSTVPPDELLQEVYKTIHGDKDNKILYPGYAAAGTRVFTGAITITAINVTYELTLLATSSLTTDQAKILIEAAAYDYINSLPTGQDVLYDGLKANMLLAHPDVYKLRLITPSTDVSVPKISQAQLGGVSGGTISGEVIGRVNPT